LSKTEFMAASSQIAVYPGSFDPFTNGHLDIIRRGLRIFSKVLLAVAKNSGKDGLFSLEERLDMIRSVIDNSPEFENVTAVKIDGLLVHFVREIGSTSIIRGLRTASDFEYEFQMAMMNKRMAPDIETMFFMTGESVFFIHSNTIKEVVRLGGDTTGLIPEEIEEKIRKRLRR